MNSIFYHFECKDGIFTLMKDQQDKNIDRFYRAYGGFGITFEDTIDRIRDIICFIYIIKYRTSKEDILRLLADDLAFSIFIKLQLVLKEYYSDKESEKMMKKVYQYINELIAFRNGIIHGQWTAGLTTAASPNIAFGYHNKSKSTKGEIVRNYILTSEELEVIISELREFNLLLANIRNRISQKDPITNHKDDVFFEGLSERINRLKLNRFLTYKG